MKATSASVIVASLGLAACSGQGKKLSATGTGDVSNPEAARLPFDAELVAACGDGVVSERGAEAIDRLPYVQRVDDSSASVVYTVTEEVAEPREVELRSVDGRVAKAIRPAADEKSRGGRQRVARFDGLEPDTLYCYSIGEALGPIGFRTAPEPGAGKPARFVAFGDSGSGSPQQSAVRDQLTNLQYDLMLHVGDIAYGSGTLAQFETTFFDVYAELLESVPTFPVPGNHDYETNDAAPYLEVFDLPTNGGAEGLERWYSFDWGDVHFVALDSQRLGDVQSAWLERDLQRNELPWVVAYLHHPPFSSGDHGSNHSVRRQFVPIFERHGVQLVLAGHDHNYERTHAINGVTYVVTGGGGRGTRGVGGSSFTAYAEGVLHFVYGEIEQDSMVLHAIDGVGREFDSVRIER